MGQISTIFWDIGGVILTNGWDTSSRQQAAAQFHLDWEDHQERHELAFPVFEIGQLDLDQYLDRTVFYRDRAFTRNEFKAFMFAQSRELPESRAVLREVSRSGRYFLATINNEPRELNDYRIREFRLRDDFRAFFSSCYVGARKPDAAIYRAALDVTQCPAEHCLFIDDRALNLECAARLGMRTIQFRHAAQLQEDLRRHGVTL